MKRPRLWPAFFAGLLIGLLPALSLAETRVARVLPLAFDEAELPAPFAPAIGEAAAASGKVPRSPVASMGVLPGEFEKQSAIVLGCEHLVDDMPELFAQLATHLRGRVDVLALVRGEKARTRAVKVLTDHNIAAAHVHFVNVAHNSMWARDFGPLTVRQPDGRPALIDPWYTSGERVDDDAVPAILSEALGVPVIDASMYLDGGNLLSNGRGLLVATYHLVDKNLNDENQPKDIRFNLGQLFGAEEVIFLEPLIGEPTGHVDMFTTFVSTDTVVVASIDPTDDAENARILDRNAARLASVRVGHKRLRVVRIPMPAHQDGVWRSYTNVLYANGLLLVPTYPEKDRAGSQVAIATYKRLLPHWQVEAIDAEQLAGLGGALHCISMNMAVVDRWPLWIAPN